MLSLLTVKNVRNLVAGRYCRGSSMDTRVNDMVCVGRSGSNCPKHLVRSDCGLWPSNANPNAEIASSNSKQERGSEAYLIEWVT